MLTRLAGSGFALKAGVAMVTVLVILAGGWFILRQQAKIGALVERTVATEQLLLWERERSARFRSQVQAVQQEYFPVRTEVQNANTTNIEWSGAPVPSAVLDSLCRKGDCATVGGGAVPPSQDRPKNKRGP